MEFKALCIGVRDRTLDDFGSSCCTGVNGDSTGKKHAFPSLCKGHRNGKQFLGRHGQFDIHLCLSRYALASVIAIKPQNPADFLCVCA